MRALRRWAGPILVVGWVVGFVGMPLRVFAGQENLIEYIRGREDLTKKERVVWERALKLSFGAIAMDPHTQDRPELGVAKAIISIGIFNQAKPGRTCRMAKRGWLNVQNFVPPPIAIHYWRLALEGRRPRGVSPADLAFNFPKYYNEEIAPDLVEYWETALRQGKIPDYALEETKRALAATRVKMRPLLLDKLRLLASLDQEALSATGARRAEIRRDMAEVENELKAAFSKVARRPEVLAANRRPYDRLRIQLDDMGLSMTDEDRALEPVAPPPPEPPVVEPPPPEPPPREPPPPAQPRVEPPREPPPPPAQPRVEPPPPPPAERREPEPPPRRVVPPPSKQAERRARRRSTPRRRRSSVRTVAALKVQYKRQLTNEVDEWLGTPYRWGNETKGVGTDCSGFTQGVFREAFEIRLPRVSRDQYRKGTSVSRRNLRPGDLVFFDTLDQGRITHVGVFVEGNKFAHAGSSRGVVYANLRARYFQRAYRGARRVLTYP